MDPEQRRKRGSRGGLAAHKNGTAYRWTHETAMAAGKKGGLEAQRRWRERVQNGPTTAGQEE